MVQVTRSDVPGHRPCAGVPATNVSRHIICDQLQLILDSLTHYVVAMRETRWQVVDPVAPKINAQILSFSGSFQQNRTKMTHGDSVRAANLKLRCGAC